MSTFTASLTELLNEQDTEPSLWDQGAWIREHGSGNLTTSLRSFIRLVRPPSIYLRNWSARDRVGIGWMDSLR